MKRALVIGITVAGLIAGAMVHAQSPRSAEVQMKAAQQKAEVEGDLKGAIEEYKKVVATAGSNRALAAEALVRMAECYQKLGDTEARKLYGRVIRDFADQKEAVAIARSRLGQTTSPAAVRADRAAWTGPRVDLFGRVSPNGRFITFVDWQASGNLMVHDLVSNTDRALTPSKNYDVGEAGYSSISPDGKLVAYSWREYKAHRVVLQTVALDGSGRPRDLIAFPETEVRFISPFDWSPDGRWIALLLSRTDGTSQITIVAVGDGAMRVLKTAAWKGPSRIFFSRDSRHIAYDLAADDNQQPDIFILAIDGSRETPAVVHSASDVPMGWSPDGSLLLFSSDRTGSTGLWGLPVTDGKPTSAPELLKADIGNSTSLGLTAAGAMYVFKGISSRDIRVAAIDLQAGKLGVARHFERGYLPGPRLPDWSPDGKHLAYQACSGGCIAVRSVETGEVRRVPEKLLYPVRPRWSPDGRTFVAAGRDARGRDGIFLVDAQTGDVTNVVHGPGFTSVPQWSPEGTRIYFTYPRGTIIERELASGNERVVYKHPEGVTGFGVAVSPDGRLLAMSVRTETSTARLVVPVEGGPPRELLRVTSPDTLGPQRWTPDSSSLLISKTTAGRTELLLVPTSGATPRRFDIDVSDWMQGGAGAIDQGFSLSPDGRQIAFLTGKTVAEVWALENFLPARRSTK